jgi:DNA-binding transcriptional regulator WhiA
MKYTDEFKSIDTPNKAYLLGLIYSDGTIINNIGQQYACRIKINDVELLYKIIDVFPFFCAPKKSKDEKSWYIYCYSKQYVIDLMSHGLVPSKSIKNIHLLGNPGILLYPGDFLRGVFDGDGNVYVDSNNNKKITIYGNCASFFKYLIGIYDEYDIRYSLVSRRNQYELKVGRQASMINIVNLMTNNDALYMQRKWDVINNLTWKSAHTKNNQYNKKPCPL